MTIDNETARAAGVEVWVIPTGSQPEAVLAAGRPDRLMHDFADLLCWASARNSPKAVIEESTARR
jgi:hypothetical protein